MATAPEGAVERFIDKVQVFLVKAEPFVQAAEQAMVAAEPMLALTPAGPEYQVAVSAILGAQQVAQVSLAAGTTLTGMQKAAIAVNAATPALTNILSSKGISVNTEVTISIWIQNIFNILAGPVASIVSGKSVRALKLPVNASAAH